MAEENPGGAPPDPKALESKINELTESIGKLEGNNKALVEEKRKVEAELKAFKDKGKEASELLPEKEQRIKELEGQLTETKTAKEAEEQKRIALETSVKKSYIDQLPENHKGIASLIPTIDGLAEYVKLNGTPPPPPSNSGKPGTGNIDTTGKKWEDFNDTELADLRKANFKEYSRLYREVYGVNPVEKF